VRILSIPLKERSLSSAFQSPSRVTPHSSRYDIGYDYGMLLGAKSLDTWDKLLSWVTQGHDALNPLVNGILLWQWNIALNQQLPDE